MKKSFEVILVSLLTLSNLVSVSTKTVMCNVFINLAKQLNLVGSTAASSSFLNLFQKGVAY